MARLDAFDADAQPEPPDRKLAQVEQRVSRSEGHAVIAADVGRQAALLKKPLKHCKSVLFSGRRKSLTGEEITAGVIGDRQRIAILPIAQQELPFVIGAPKFVGTLAQGQRRALRATTETAAALDQTVAIQQRMDGTFRRNLDAGESADQALANLTRTPGGVLTLHVQGVVLHLERQLVRIVMRAAASVGQSLHATFLVAFKDLVAGLTRDPELPAKFRHRLAG